METLYQLSYNGKIINSKKNLVVVAGIEPAASGL
jgi:hypothetical protein